MPIDPKKLEDIILKDCNYGVLIRNTSKLKTVFILYVYNVFIMYL